METDTTDTKANDAQRSAPDDPCLVYSPREDASPEGELAALAAVYKFVLERHNERKKSSGNESEGEGARSSSSQERYPMARNDE
jgi:hypothetical protein